MKQLNDLITILLSLAIPPVLKVLLAVIVTGTVVLFVSGCNAIGPWETSIVAASKNPQPPTSPDTSQKKLTTEGAPGLDGKHPEFARMSLRPGIGAGAAAEISDTLIKHRLDNAEHLPTSLRHGKLKYPVGRYIREKTRQQTGISKEELQAFLDENSDPKVRALREAAFANAPPGSKAFAFKQALIDSAQGRITQIEQKHRAKRKEIL